MHSLRLPPDALCGFALRIGHRRGQVSIANDGSLPTHEASDRLPKGMSLAFVLMLLSGLIAAPHASGQTRLLDSFTNATTPDGVFGSAAARSIVGFPGGGNINTAVGEARLTADNLETPTFSGLAYNFTPSQTLLSKVTLTARNRQPSALETGILSIGAVTNSGTFTLSQTLPGNTATMQTYDFDFAALAGTNMSLQKLNVTWDLPLGATGLRGLAIDKIDLYAVPEPSTYAMALTGTALGGWQMWRGSRRRKQAVRAGAGVIRTPIGNRRTWQVTERVRDFETPA